MAYLVELDRYRARAPTAPRVQIRCETHSTGTAETQTPQVPRHLCGLAGAFDRIEVTRGAHVDPDSETRKRYSLIGARICVLPTAHSAVTKAVENPEVTGAPNVTHGGSQSGNILAVSLVRDGHVDALVSGYSYP